MVVMEVYDPDRWTDFFILVGTGAATLAGLVFVAMTINSRVLTADATHKYRAINMLSGFTAVFVLSALALMGGQTYRLLGFEWLVVSILATVINTNGYVQAYRIRSSLYALGWMRILVGSACYVGQIVGAVMICLDLKAGVYVAATSLIANFCVFVSGAWLLIVGTLREPDESPGSA